MAAQPKELNAIADQIRAAGKPLPPRMLAHQAPAAKPEPGHNSRSRARGFAADQPSTCFSDLRYSPQYGGVFATFTDGYQAFYPASRSEARDWLLNSDSLGKTFNAEWR